MRAHSKAFGNYCVTAAAMLAAGCSYTTQSAKVHQPFVPVAHRSSFRRCPDASPAGALNPDRFLSNPGLAGAIRVF